MFFFAQLPCPFIAFGTENCSKSNERTRQLWNSGIGHSWMARKKEFRQGEKEKWKTLELLPFEQQPAQSFALTLQQD